ncbi:MAG: hypothetical protein ABIH42_10330, partial [Planctomycetota bacterium]
LAKRRGKGQGVKILQDTRRMRNDVRGSLVFSDTGAEMGTNISYAKKHQEGDGVSKRVFLWLSDDAKNKILDRFLIHLKGN